MPEVLVRDAVSGDVLAIAAIYRHYVLTSAATMELEAPDEAEMARRLGDVRGRGLPYLVAEADGEVVGYGYASAFRPRAGYRQSLAQDRIGGVGRAGGTGKIRRSRLRGGRNGMRRRRRRRRG